MELSKQYPDFFVCDIASLQNKFGRDFMFASNIYVSTEMVLSVPSIPYVASKVMDIVCATKGQFKKCLIIDLDNTIWGGIIGDDGLENIQLGHGLGIGKAFSEIQMWIKKLQQRGIIICVVSKNEETTAKEVFEKHPDMILRLEDIAVFQANWESKVDNIRTIQKIRRILLYVFSFMISPMNFEKPLISLLLSKRRYIAKINASTRSNIPLPAFSEPLTKLSTFSEKYSPILPRIFFLMKTLKTA